MKTLMLEFSYISQKSKSKLVRPLFHYDVDKQKMERFDGGSLSYTWNWKTKRLEPKAVDVGVCRTHGGLDKDRIKEWVKRNMLIFDFEVNHELSTTQGIAIDINDDIQEEVEDSLGREGIRYSEI